MQKDSEAFFAPNWKLRAYCFQSIRMVFNSRRKGSTPVLPRVTSAIVQFIRPISSSGVNTALTSQGKSPVFQKSDSNQQKKQQKQEKVLKIVPAQETAPPASESSVGRDPSMAMLNLFQVLSSGKEVLTQFLGKKIYSKSSGTLKKAVRFRKGTMLDQDAG